MLERDAEKRAAIYDELQKAVLDDGPFVDHVPADRGRGAAQERRTDFVIGPSFDTNSVRCKPSKN